MRQLRASGLAPPAWAASLLDDALVAAVTEVTAAGAAAGRATGLDDGDEVDTRALPTRQTRVSAAGRCDAAVTLTAAAAKGSVWAGAAPGAAADSRLDTRALPTRHVLVTILPCVAAGATAAAETWEAAAPAAAVAGIPVALADGDGQEMAAGPTRQICDSDTVAEADRAAGAAYEAGAACGVGARLAAVTAGDEVGLVNHGGEVGAGAEAERAGPLVDTRVMPTRHV